MTVSGNTQQPSTVASALQRLARARARERWIRAAFWLWFTSVFVWLLPLGRWTAPGLDTTPALLVGAVLALCGAALVVLHHSISRTAGIRAAVRDAKRLHPQTQEPRQATGLLPASRPVAGTTAATAVVAAMLVSAPLARDAYAYRPGSGAAWLLYPLAGAILAARWHLRGALVGLLAGVAGVVAVEGWILDGIVLDQPADQTVIAASIVLTAVLPAVIAWMTPSRPLSAAQARRVAEELRIARAERSIRASEERFRSLVQNASDVTTILDADGTRRYVSPSVLRVLGYRPEELVGANFFALIHPDDAARVLSIHLECLNNPGSSPLIEFRCRDKDGDWRHLESITNNLLDDPSVRGIVVSSRDITERKAFEEQLARQAFYDSLTGLPNRALFMDRLGHVFARSGRERQHMAVMFLDLDRFKIINDSLGHGAGDDLLVTVGRELARCLRPGDTVARFGGDEFTLLIENVQDVTDATSLAGRIIEALSRPFTLAGHEVFATASIGIALSTSHHTQPADLLRDADVALYRAKAAGRAGYVVFNPNMNADAVEQLDLEADLRRAVERQELRLYYQPEVELETGRLVGMEALVRWAHPVRGLIAPGGFIALAEETGLILQIGQWVLQEACRQARAWQLAYPRREPLVMSVNLSARQFQQPDFVQQVDSALKATGLEPASLRLEITESAVMQDAESTVHQLQALKALGVRVAIDDFGTGYSSLSYLRRFAVDTLKVDRSFVAAMGHDEGTVAIVQAVTALAQALNIEVTAEGIETPEQLARVRALNCAFGQGYYFSGPLAGQELTRVLEADRLPVVPDDGVPPRASGHLPTAEGAPRGATPLPGTSPTPVRGGGWDGDRRPA